MEEAQIVSFILSGVSLISSVAIVVRLFTKTEVAVDQLKTQASDTAALARQTHDYVRSEMKVESELLRSRTSALESNVLGLASQKSLDALSDRIQMSLAHLEKTITAELRFQQKRDEHDHS